MHKQRPLAQDSRDAMSALRTGHAAAGPLTGLVGKAEFERRLSEAIAAAHGTGREPVLLYIAFPAGAISPVTAPVENAIAGHLRVVDTAAWLEPGTFGVLLMACPLDQAIRIANGIREAVRDVPGMVGSHAGTVTIDVVPLHADDATVDEWLARAVACSVRRDFTLSDRVQVCPGDAAVHGQASVLSDELQLVSQIDRAFETGRFQLYRQAIVPLHGDSAGQRHYEILVRMKDSEGKLVPPAAFMPAAERYHLLTEIDRWVVTAVLDHVEALWQQRRIPADPGPGGFYGVNLSGASLNNPGFPEFLRESLARYTLPARLLCFEITESTAIANLPAAAELIRELQALGCRFALDDFGTGMASFSYLKYLPADCLKVAGVFVKGMTSDPIDAAIVEAIHRIAHVAGMRTVAESVEDEATLAAVTRLGIDFAQGYHIAVPEALHWAGVAHGEDRA